MFPFKTFCFLCEEEIRVTRLNNNVDMLTAYIGPHQCGKTHTAFSRLKLAWAVLIGKPTGYFTDKEEEKDE